MYKVLIDTNIIIDFLYKRQPFYTQSKQIIQMVESKIIEGCITTSILMDLHYIIWHRLGSKKDANSACQAMMNIFNILDVNSNDIDEALKTNPTDFEDKVVEKCSIRNNCDFIVTRNIKHFDSKIALEPQELIDKINN